MIHKLTRTIVRTLALALGLGLVPTVWAAPYVMSNADGSAHRWDGKYGHQSGAIVINLSTPSTLHGTGNFPASGKAALTCISISSRGQDTNSRTDTDTSSTWMHNLDHVELVEQDGATYTSSRVEILDGAVDAANKFTTTLAASDSTYSANGYSGDGTGRFTYNIYFDLVKVDVTKNLTLRTYSDATTTMQLGTAAVASTKTGTDWKAPLRVYGTYYYDADTSVSDLNAKIATSSDSEVVFVFEDGVSIDVDAAFSATIPVKIVSSGSITLTAADQPDVSYFTNVDFSGVSGGVLRLWLTPGVVGYNFKSGSGSDTSLALVSGGTWLYTADSATGTTTDMFADGLSTFEWSSANTWAWSSGTLLNGYLDDGGDLANIALSNVPYETYDVIVYAATDDNNVRTFRPVTVNGTQYTWDGNSGEAVSGSANWGTSRQLLAEYGINALRINNLSGPLTIKGGNNGSGGRGCIAAIQIVPAGTLDSDYTLTLDGTDASWSTGEWTLNGETVSAPTEAHSVEIVASASTTLTIDTAATVANLKIKGSGDAAVTISKGTAALTTKQVTVESGILKHGADNGPLGSPASIVVKNGGAMDLANTASRCYSVTIEGQGVQKDGAYTGALYSSVAIGNGSKQLKGIALSGDATVRCDNDWGIINSGYAAATMDVGSYTLTKLGTENFWLCNAAVTGAGTIKIAEGYLTTIGYGSVMSSATMEIANGATLNLSGAGLTVNTLTCRNGSNVQVASGKNLSFTNINLEGTVSYKGPISASDQSINIPSDVTFKWVDTSWTSGNYFAGSGTLELMADSAQTDHTVAGSTFGGIVKLSNDSDGKQNNLKASETAAMFSNRPELIVNASSVHLGPNWNNNLEHPIQVRNLSGSGQLRGQWGSGTFNYLIETLQERDTAYTGTLGCDESGGNRYVNFSVIGNNPDEVHSLTITRALNTGDNNGCRASTITVAEDAKVVFTSVGKWGNGNIIVNEDGWLESTNMTAAANITLNDGSTVVVPYVNSASVPLGGTTVTLPEDGTVYFDMSGVNVAGGTTVNVISATTLSNGSSASFEAKSGKWDFNVVDNTVTATKKVLAWDGSSWSDDDYAGYTDASIAVSGATSVTLPATLNLQKLTLTGSSGTLTIDANGHTLTVGDIEIPEGVTLAASSALTVTGNISGDGSFVVPNGVTFTANCVISCSGNMTVNGTLNLNTAPTCVVAGGSGTINLGSLSVANGISNFASAAEWKGNVVIPAITISSATTINFNDLGNTGSMVTTKDINRANVTVKIIAAEAGATINPTLKLDGGRLWLTVGSSSGTRINCVTGSGNLLLGSADNNTSYRWTVGTVTNYTGRIGAEVYPSYGIDTQVAIETIALSSGTVLNTNDPVLNVYNDANMAAGVSVESTVATVGGEDTEYRFIRKDSPSRGIYLSPATIKLTNGTITTYESVSAALVAAESLSASAYDYLIAYESATVEYSGGYGLKLKTVGDGVSVSLTMPAAYGDLAWSGSAADENGVVTYSSTGTTPTTYTWGGGDGAWIPSNWKFGAGNYSANRAVADGDTLVFDSNAAVTSVGTYTVASITVGATVSLSATSERTLTATTGGIVLSAAGASITVDRVTLSPTPTTSVANYVVQTTGGSDDPTVYTAVLGAATVEGTPYLTLKAAIAAAGDNTVILLRDNTEDDIVLAAGRVVNISKGEYTCATPSTVDGVDVIPSYNEGTGVTTYTSPVAKVTTSSGTQGYADTTTALGVLATAIGSDESATMTILDGSSMAAYVSYLPGLNIYYDSVNGVMSKAVAKTNSETFNSLASAISGSADGATITLLRNSLEANVSLNKTITLNETATFSGSFTGSGTIVLGAALKAPSADRWAAGWTGTVELKDITTVITDFDFAHYGNANSTVRANDVLVRMPVTSGEYGNVGTIEVATGGLKFGGDPIENANFTFAAAITGTGTIGVGTRCETGSKRMSQYIFTGSMSGFAGGVDYNNTGYYKATIVFKAGDDEIPQRDTDEWGQILVSENTTLKLSKEMYGPAGIVLAGTINVLEGGSIRVDSPSGKQIKGSGTINYTTFPSSAPMFNNAWAGTVHLPGKNNLAGEDFGNFGKSGSKIVIDGDMAGWIAQNTSVTAEFVLDGHSLTVNDFSPRSYSFSKISGSGALSFNHKEGNAQPTTLSIGEVMATYSGTINNNTATTLTINKLVLPAIPACDAKVLAVGGTGEISLDVGNVKVGEASLPAKYKLERRHVGEEGDGFYVYYNGTIFSVY